MKLPGEALYDALAEMNDAEAVDARRENLIALMQDAVRNYLEPTTYVRKTRNGDGSRGFVDMPSTYQAEATTRSIGRKRGNMFINDIIYFLDSEEHGTNVPQAINGSGSW